MNTQRRTFRGRGGPTDGRLPKHNARRRRRALDQLPHKPATNKYQDQDQDPQQQEEEEEEDEHDTGAVLIDNIDKENGSSEEASSSSSVENESKTNQEAEVATNIVEDVSMVPAGDTAAAVLANASDDHQQDERINPCVKEVKHLKKRIQNIRETMSLSHSISNPKTYQDNVLNAVSNCVNEWRSIVMHYPPAPTGKEEIDAMEEENDDDDDDDQFYLTSELRKPAALAVFEMIQQAIQSGPLAGSKPGYFKRCGGDVAKVVETFLDEVVPHALAMIQLMGFTPKQMDAMEMWKRNAQKAVLENKPPSRAALKHQQGKGTGKKAKKKMKGK